MTKIAAGSNATFLVPASSTVTVTGGLIRFEYPSGTVVYEGDAAGQSFGPFSSVANATITCLIGGCDYAVDAVTAHTTYDSANVAITGGVISTGVSLRAPTVVLFGDSRTADCNLDVSPNQYSTNMSWWDWGAAQVVGGPPLDVIANAGVAGNTTTQMQARLYTDVIAKRPGHATIWAGTNDPWASISEVDASFARMASMIDQMRAAGIYVFVISETVANSKGTTFPAYVLRYNDLLRAYCALNAGCEFWDFNSQIIDPTSANGFPKASMLRDGLHLSPLGASTVGKNVVAQKLARFSAGITSLVTSPIDTVSLHSESRNVFPNPLMSGSVAASGTGQTGTWPTNWSTTGQSAVCSTPARSDGFGNDLQCDITASGAGSFFATLAASSNVGSVLVGGIYVLEAALSITSAVNVSQVSLTTDVSISGVGTFRFGWGYAVQATAAGDSLVDFNGVIRSRKFVIPSGGAVAGLSGLKRVAFAGAGSASTRVARPTLKLVG